jgi:hypothetical protein
MISHHIYTADARRSLLGRIARWLWLYWSPWAVTGCGPR